MQVTGGGPQAGAWRRDVVEGDLKRRRLDVAETIFVTVFGLIPMAFLALILVAGIIVWIF